MAAASNQVTLTFAANAQQLKDGLNQVDAALGQTENAMGKAGVSAAVMSEKLEAAHYQLRGVQELSKGAGDAALLLGGNMGQAAAKFSLAVVAAKDLAGGLGRATKAMKDMNTAELLMRGGVIGAAAAVAWWAASTEGALNKTRTWKTVLDDTNYALATNVHFVTQGIPLIGSLTGRWQSSADAMSQAAHSAYDLAGGLAAANKQMAANGLGNADGPTIDAFSYSDMVLNGTAGISGQFADSLQADADSAAAAAREARSGGGGGGVSAAVKAENERAQQALNDWQATVDKARQVSQSVMDALNPKLDSSNGGPGTNAPGGGVIGNLRKQLLDTKNLASDIQRLTKGGLDRNLIDQLLAGGLSSLPAANQILATKGGIGRANALSEAITSAASPLAARAGIDASRGQQTVRVTVDVTGGEGDLKKLVRKWVRVDGGGNVQLALGQKGK